MFCSRKAHSYDVIRLSVAFLIVVRSGGLAMVLLDSLGFFQGAFYLGCSTGDLGS
ncbi:MAG: hypothetical protein M2R46_05163 [Verrucomicrobia subdivision 3 bacterium]|nr:hypothetical protein [Limisphaerales bacterium]